MFRWFGEVLPGVFHSVSEGSCHIWSKFSTMDPGGLARLGPHADTSVAAKCGVCRTDASRRFSLRLRVHRFFPRWPCPVMQRISDECLESCQRQLDQTQRAEKNRTE